MNQRDLVLNAGYGGAVDRIPVTPYMGNFGARVAGVPIDRYCSDSETLASAQLAAQKVVGQDALVAQSDGYYMAEGLGMETYSRPGTTPAPRRWPIEDLAQIDSLRVPDPNTAGRMPVFLGAIKRMRAEVGDDLAIRPCGTGAFSLAGHMLGPENFVMAIALLSIEPDPEAERRLRSLMEICTETTIAFSLAALEAGADIVVDADSLASLDMISPEIYESWVWPYERTYFEGVTPKAKERGALTLLHICGNTTPILPLMAQTGTQILELDWKVDLADARRFVDDNSLNSPGDAPPAIMGNLDPSAVLLQGTPADIRSACLAAMRKGVRSLEGSAIGTSFYLGSGCEVTPDTPPANIQAMVQSASM